MVADQLLYEDASALLESAPPQHSRHYGPVETLFSNKTMIPSTLPVMRLTGSNGVRLNPWNG
ncbi:hypothetical protein ANCDUO_11079 [Ancylostoma duodenale]|uniref:Uncharacterized protein n=1 Tax=Ancylostoma duodenale TaxID=51022 RepID=A0A0C2GNY6_9BILA|nr:hypothetical protein ANCDUO_11079 [Ancylostoma duodenale]